MAREQVAFIGLGGMGLAMAANLKRWLDAEGFPALLVWNRTASKATAFAKDTGAIVVDTLEELAERADVVIASLANDTAADEVYTKLFDAKKGASNRSVFIETSTLYPDFVVAKKAQLTVVIAGDEEARKIAARFCVPSIGKATIDVGPDVRRAASLKLVGNSLIAGVIEILAESMTLADKCGVGSELLTEFVEKVLASARSSRR